MGVARDALLALELLAFGLLVGALALEHPLAELTKGPQLVILVVGVAVLVMAMVVTDLILG